MGCDVRDHVHRVHVRHRGVRDPGSQEHVAESAEGEDLACRHQVSALEVAGLLHHFPDLDEVVV